MSSFLDTNRRYTIDYDQAATQPWTRISTDYNEANQADYQVTVYDTGATLNRDWDTLFQYAWSIKETT